MPNWITATVIKVKCWTDDLFSLTVRASIEPFIAGQFAKLGLEIDGELVQRAYSYVNSPDNQDLEFYLVTIPNGRLTPYLSSLKPNDNIQISKKASGFFILKEIPNCDTLWMLATGTGIGPYLSILQHKKGLERFKNIVLVHAVRYADDLSYLVLMKKLQKYYKGKLRVQTVISREKTSYALTGRIPALIKSGELENVVGLPMNTNTSHVMLCGNPQMIRDTQNLLKETRNMTKHMRSRVGYTTSEHYW